MTGRATSPSSIASRISARAASRCSSVSLPCPRRFLKVRCSFAVRFSNMVRDQRKHFRRAEWGGQTKQRCKTGITVGWVGSSVRSVRALFLSISGLWEYLSCDSFRPRSGFYHEYSSKSHSSGFSVLSMAAAWHFSVLLNGRARARTRGCGHREYVLARFAAAEATGHAEFDPGYDQRFRRLHIEQVVGFS